MNDDKLKRLEKLTEDFKDSYIKSNDINWLLTELKEAWEQAEMHRAISVATMRGESKLREELAEKTHWLRQFITGWIMFKTVPPEMPHQIQECLAKYERSELAKPGDRTTKE